MKLILGFTGQIASGKGTACDYLIKKYHAGYHRFSTPLFDILNRIYLPTDRDHLQKTSSMLRETFGQETLAKILSRDVENDKHEIICIDGIRRPQDIQELKQFDGFVLIHIFADMKKRFNRITKRNEKVDDQNKTFEEFKQDHQKEAELLIQTVGENADVQIDNNGEIDNLHLALDKIISEYKQS